MTDTRTKLALKSFRLKKVLLSVTAVMAVCAPSIQAADDQWWFDVEVIVFERQVEPATILEQFEQSSLAPPSGELVDLLTPYLKPDLSFLRAGLSYCRESKRLEVEAKNQQDFAFLLRDHSDKDLPDSAASAPTSSATDLATAEVIDGPEPQAGNFEYEVVSDDIFSKEAELDTIALPSEPELIQTTPTQPWSEDAVTPSAFEVEYVEWQIPSVFPCVYSEQVDPILSFVSHNTDNQNSQQVLPIIDKVPVEIDGIQWQQKRGPFLLPKDTLRMQGLFSKIQKQRDITPILHLSWRQEVLFGRENASAFRLFAGKNFASQFDSNGQVLLDDTDRLMTSLHHQQAEKAHPDQAFALADGLDHQDFEQKQLEPVFSAEQSSEQLFAQLDAALEDDSPISFKIPVENAEIPPQTPNTFTKLEDIWQLDGSIKVYLQNVGRVPYLHIDNQLDYRQAIYRAELSSESSQDLDVTMPVEGITNGQLQEPNYLQSVTFNQLRRVISKQVHYFDHPLFGMIIRIHRYRWPEQDSTSDDATE